MALDQRFVRVRKLLPERIDHRFTRRRRRLGVLARVLLVTATAMAAVCIGGAMGIPGSSPAFADTVVDGCTIVSNPTQANFTSCPGANLSGADLSGLDLSFANLSGATFVNCALDTLPPECSTADLTGTDLTDANLSNSIFWLCSDLSPLPPLCGSAELSHADLTGADLTASVLVTDLTDANLTDANLTNASFDGCGDRFGEPWECQSATLTGAILTGAILTGTPLMPSNQTVDAMTGAGSVVTWPVPPARPGATPGPCTPPSGSTFPIGTTTVTCTVADDAGDNATGTFQVVVRPYTSLWITTTSLPPATIGEPYSAQLTASNGNPPYIWHRVFGTGKLPWHLTLNRLTGVISGVPNKSSVTTTFTVRVFDTRVSNHPHRRDTAIATFTIAISP